MNNDEWATHTHTHTPLNNVKNYSSVSDGTAASPYTVQPQLELMQKCFSVVKVCVCVCVCVYNLHARIQLVYMDMYQASFCVGWCECV